MAYYLHAIKKQIKDGDTAGAESALVDLLRITPDNADAWMLLGSISDNPSQKAECYQQALRINPKNKHALKQMQALLNGSSQNHAQGAAPGLALTLRCPQCGGAQEVHFVGEMMDKRAICSFCGTEMDIPDWYQRIKKKRAREWKYDRLQTIEDTVIETRRDGGSGPEIMERLPSELEEIKQVLKEKGLQAFDDDMRSKFRLYGVSLSFGPDALTPQVLQALRDSDFALSFGAHTPTEKTIYIRKEQQEDRSNGHIFPIARDEEQSNDLLSKAETVKFFGVAPAPEDTRKCSNPQCGATIPKNAKVCSWCGEEL